MCIDLKSSFLLLSLLLFALATPQLGCLHQLLDQLLLFNLGLQHEFLPLLIQLCFSDFASFFFHSALLFQCVFGQVLLSEFFVFRSHVFTLFPFLEALSIV